jgi:hypothetical protein
MTHQFAHIATFYLHRTGFTSRGVTYAMASAFPRPSAYIDFN